MPKAEAKYTLKADDKTAQGLRSAEGRLQRFTRRAVIGMTRRFSAMKGIIAGIGASFIGWGTSIVRATGDLDELAKSAKDVNATVSEMAEAQLAAELLGVDPDRVIRWFDKIQKKALDATNGLSEAQRTFNQLGLDAEQVQKLGIEDTFVAVAAALGRIEETGRRTGLRQELGLTRGAGRFFGGGAEPVLEAFGEAERLGVGVKIDEAADRAERFSDAWAKLTAVAVNFWRRATMSEGMIQAMEDAATGLAGVGGTDARRFVDLSPSTAAQRAMRDPTAPKEATQKMQLEIQKEMLSVLQRGGFGVYGR